MSGTIINNSSDPIQVYIARTSGIADLDPQLQQLSTPQVPVVGSKSSADTGIAGSGSNIYVAVWKESDSKSPNSWTIYNENARVLSSKFDNYNIVATGNSKDGWVATISGRQGSSGWLKWILVVGIIILVLILLVLGGYFIFRKQSVDKKPVPISGSGPGNIRIL